MAELQGRAVRANPVRAGSLEIAPENTPKRRHRALRAVGKASFDACKPARTKPRVFFASFWRTFRRVIEPPNSHATTRVETPSFARSKTHPGVHKSDPQIDASQCTLRHRFHVARVTNFDAARAAFQRRSACDFRRRIRTHFRTKKRARFGCFFEASNEASFGGLKRHEGTSFLRFPFPSLSAKMRYIICRIMYIMENIV